MSDPKLTGGLGVGYGGGNGGDGGGRGEGLGGEGLGGEGDCVIAYIHQKVSSRAICDKNLKYDFGYQAR